MPSHWEVRRIRDAIAFSVNGVWGEEPDGIHDLPCVRVADFDRKRLRVNEPVPTIRAIPPNQRRNRVLEYGDLLLEKSGGGERQPVGVVMLFDHETPAVCSNFIARMSVKDGYDPFFLTFLFSALYSIRLNTRSIKQTTGIQNLDSFAYLNEYVALPPLAEQRAIAAYLDRKGEIARRHADVSARLIACLRELRQAEIRQAVTRGLDEDAPLRASGVEWLGDVPEHWEVRRLKRICRFAYGDSLSSEQRNGGDIPVYGSNGQIDNHSVPNTTGECVIIGRKGSFGKVHYSPKPAFAIDTTFFVDKRYTDANLRWLFYLLGTLGLDAVSMDSAVPGLNREYAYSHISPYPPLAEQAAIAAHLDGRMAAIDAAIAHCEREAALVGEYWARLAADAVTGQVDVRGMV